MRQKLLYEKIGDERLKNPVNDSRTEGVKK